MFNIIQKVRQQMKTYKLQELQGRYFATIPVELVKTLGLTKKDKLSFALYDNSAILITKQSQIEEVKEEVKEAQPCETQVLEQQQ